MGPYFNHDVVLRAAAGPLFAVQDSDDESDPDRFRLQLTTMHHQCAEAVHTPVIQAEGETRRTIQGSAKSSTDYKHHADHFGLYSVNALLALGGYHAGFRVGYDTAITSYLNLLAPTRMTPKALYTRYARPGSLTASEATGHRSNARAQARRALRLLWDEALAQTSRSRRNGADAIKAEAQERARKHGDPQLRAALVKETKEALARVELEPPRIHGDLLTRVASSARTSQWSISAELSVRLYRHCEAKRPRIILDVGSGASTAVLALYAARYGARLISLEHDEGWHRKTGAILQRMGLRAHAQLVHAPLKMHSGSLWYDARLGGLLGDDKIDLVFIDGPPEKVGARGDAMQRVLPHLRDGTAVWLHDGKRPQERAAVEAWKKLVTVRSCELDVKADQRGTFMLEVAP
jgi:predicted O-methyltransferase YrrM